MSAKLFDSSILADAADAVDFMHGIAAFIQIMPPRCPNPTNLLVTANDLALKVPIATRRHGLAEFPVHEVSVLRQYVFQEHLVGPLRQQRFVAEDAVVLQRAMGGMVNQIQRPFTHAHAVQGEAQPFLALPQHSLCPLALGDVA